MGSGSTKKIVSHCILDVTPPAEIFQRHLELRRVPSVALLCLLSVVLLVISFPPFDCWWVAYFALVPWAIAIAGGTSRKLTIGLGWGTGLIFWAASLYWLILPTVVGYIASVVYLSMYWLLASLLVGRATRRSWPMWLTLPILWVALEYAQAHVLGGFSWFYLAQSQYARAWLIQIADVTGQYGVTFFVAMVNGLVIDLLSSPLFVPRRTGGARPSRGVLAGLVGVLIVAAGLWSYGQWRLAQREECISPGPTVGIVQEAIPITLSGRAQSARAVLEYHIQRSLDFIGQGCDVLLWPETMLPMGLNSQLLRARAAELSDAEVMSIAACIYGPGAPTKYSTMVLRANIAMHIGQDPVDAYRPAAARFLLREFVRPAQLASLGDEGVKKLSQILFGPRAGDFRAEQLRGVVGLYLGEAGGVEISAEVSQAAAKLIAPGKSTATTAEGGAMLSEIRKRIDLQLARDAASLKTLRGQGAMLSVCSMLTDCPILAGGTAICPNPKTLSLPANESDQWVLQNSVLWFDPAGPARYYYAKIHLVPFSEYVPFKYSWGALHDILRRLIPPAMPQLAPGESFERFKIGRGVRTWQLITPVCFEGTDAGLCRAMVASGPKDGLVMANLSNDGWFVYRLGDGPYKGTTEQYQHFAHYVFRAVENRIPVVRAVNTGISGAVNSAGRIESVLQLPMEKYRKRTMIAGTLKAATMVDKRVSPYSRLGDVFAATASAIAVILAGMILKKQ